MNVWFLWDQFLTDLKLVGVCRLAHLVHLVGFLIKKKTIYHISQVAGSDTLDSRKRAELEDQPC